MPNVCLAIVALPNEVQRSMSQLKEQEAYNTVIVGKLTSDITRLLQENSELLPEDATRLLDDIRAGFLTGLSHAEEKVAIAENIHQTVKGHIVKLEDDLKHFEEEVRLAKLAGANKTIVHEEPAEEEDTPAGSGSRRKEKRSRSKDEAGAPEVLPVRKRSRANNALEAAVTTAQKEVASTEGHEHHAGQLPELPEGGGPELTYCYCSQPSYGDMIACDANSECDLEWFHYGCVGLESPPKDQWFCPDCTARMARNPLGSVAAAAPKDGSSRRSKPKPSFVK